MMKTDWPGVRASESARRTRLLGVLFALWIGVGGAAAASQIWLSGQKYAALSDWAEAKQFKLVWLKKGEELRLTNRWAKVVLKVDSRRVEINGINAWLSHPIASRNEIPFIAHRDLDTLLNPVLFPVANRNRTRLRIIALDPGHGGKDPGNQDGARMEKDQTLLLAKEIRKRLTQTGLKVALTRTADDFVALEERPAMAHKAGADVFVSLHYNSFAGTPKGIKGVEIYCLPPAGANSTSGESTERQSCPGNRFDEKNILLAFQLQKALVRGLGIEDRGVRRGRFAVLRPAQMPAVLIEGGFMSNPQEAKRIYDSRYRRQLAQAIVDGLLAYKRLVER